MAESVVKRRLAAILAADVVGYSSLMKADEEGTLERLKALRAGTVDPTIGDYNGRIVKLMGDGALVEFSSVVDAVRCAVAIQKSLAERNADLSERERIAFRIGINLGDIIVDDEDIYGDGVNVASRLEGLADTGGICISGTVYDQVAGKFSQTCVFMGEQTLKGFDEPIRAYAISLQDDATRSTSRIQIVDDSADSVPKEKANLAGASGPAVAVLPFRNLSRDPDQEFFVDGLSEEIVLALSASRSFPVFSSSSTFAFKGRDVDAQTVGKDLDAGYVLGGSVRRAGSQLRVSVELVNVDTGLQIWSERYDRPIDDLFAVQDDITTTVVAVVEPEIDAQEMRRVLISQPLVSMNAYELAQRGFWHLSNDTLEDYQSSLRHFESSLHADPRYARAYAGMTQGKYTAGARLWENRQAAMEEAVQHGRTALNLDGRDPRALRFFGGAHVSLGQLEEGILALRRAISIHPSYATAYSALAFALDFAGEFEDAVVAEETTERLRPGDRKLHVCMISKAIATYELKDYETAASVCRASLRLNDQFWMSNLMLAAALGQNGETEEARVAREKVSHLLPTLSEEDLLKLLPFRERAHLDHIVDGLRKARFELG